ncbi:MAG: UDP-N-acetylmuramoyl-tripeptide--D-alanyl-D-alanine ligase [Clostridia bacterium]|nr:UDP-N-acetylmuramoyl-tripeptide--D-alanyl-D-alanine ligase [Clostridia bacterium]
MIPLRLKEIAAALGTACREDAEILSICTDSRKITRGCLFIALVGERFDGHSFVASALQQGAVAAVCSKPVETDGEVLLVEDTGKAFMLLAAYYRSLFSIPVAGITGSVGKTTTKEMVYDVLSEKYNTLKNEGNLNNEIGLPTTVFRMNADYEAAILEMGMSAFGEISRLSQVAQPSIGVISKIGVSHIEHLGSREGILKAKLEILDGLKPGAPLVVNGDDDLLSTVELDDRRVIRFGIENTACDYVAKDIEQGEKETTFTVSFGGKVQTVTIPTVGIHNVYNALSAFAVGIYLGVAPEKAAEGLSKYVTSGMRQRVSDFNGITVVEDCYNASPDSMRAAVEVLRGLNAKTKALVFGDMLELGEISADAHREIGVLAARKGIDRLYTYGTMAALAAQSARENGIAFAKSYDDKNALAQELKKELRAGDAVLFKASRGMKLEEVITAFKEV